MTKLKPCPFCGGEVTLWNYEFGMVRVFECKTCRTRFIFPWNKDLSEWNKRVGEVQNDNIMRKLFTK